MDALAAGVPMSPGQDTTLPAQPVDTDSASRSGAVETDLDADNQSATDAGKAGGKQANTTPHEREASWPGYWAMGLALSAVAATATMIIADRTGSNIGGTFVLSLAFLTCAAAALCDSATRRIPNVLTYPALLIALAINLFIVPVLALNEATVPAAAWFGAPGMDSALFGFLGCAAIGIISFMFRGLGGGDVKLIAAIGAMLGYPDVGGVLFNALVFATVIGLVNLAFKGDLVRKVQAMSMSFQVNLALRRKAVDAYPFGKTEAPFGVALLLGLITAQWMPFYVPLLNWLAPGIAPPPG